MSMIYTNTNIFDCTIFICSNDVYKKSTETLIKWENTVLYKSRIMHNTYSEVICFMWRHYPREILSGNIDHAHLEIGRWATRGFFQPLPNVQKISVSGSRYTFKTMHTDINLCHVTITSSKDLLYTINTERERE